MTSSTYDETEPVASENYVTVAQTVSDRLMLTKRIYANGTQKAYDQAKHFNFYEVAIWNLYDLYSLSKRMLAKPRCCYIRARIKDKHRNVVRKCIGQDATLILNNQNWFALDIDSFAEASNDLEVDAIRVLLALPPCFRRSECFVVASANYSIKPGIRMRMFFWSDNACSNTDLKNLLNGNSANADLAIFNPVQPIYTAAPIFHDMNDPVVNRIKWIVPTDISNQTVDVPINVSYARGSEERKYTKGQAEIMRNSKLIAIAQLAPGERHNGLIKECIFFGQLIEQNVLDEGETIELLCNACDEWNGNRNTRKDMETILWSIERGKLNMGKGN